MRNEILCSCSRQIIFISNFTEVVTTSLSSVCLTRIMPRGSLKMKSIDARLMTTYLILKLATS